MDFYSALGVARDASGEDIKRAFRRLALLYHPDRHQDAPTEAKAHAALRFTEAKEAYEVLSDDAKRQLYNTSGRSAVYSAYGARPNSAHRGGGGPTWTPRARSGWSNFWYQQSRHNRHGWLFGMFSPARRHHTRADTYFHLAMGGVALAAAITAASIADPLWDQHNAGKLFKHIKPKEEEKYSHDYLQARMRLQLQMQAQAQLQGTGRAAFSVPAERQAGVLAESLAGIPEGPNGTVPKDGQRSNQPSAALASGSTPAAGGAICAAMTNNPTVNPEAAQQTALHWSVGSDLNPGVPSRAVGNPQTKEVGVVHTVSHDNCKLAPEEGRSVSNSAYEGRQTSGLVQEHCHSPNDTVAES